MYRLLRFIDNETNTAPDYEVVLELDKFEESDKILNKFIKVCKEKNLPYSDGYYDYMVIEYECFLLGIHTVRKVCGGYQPATAGF